MKANLLISQVYDREVSTSYPYRTHVHIIHEDDSEEYLCETASGNRVTAWWDRQVYASFKAKRKLKKRARQNKIVERGQVVRRVKVRI